MHVKFSLKKYSHKIEVPSLVISMTLKGRDTLEGDLMGTLNENEEYREQTDKLFIPHSACGFHVLSLDTDAKGKRGVPPPLLAAGVSRRKRSRPKDRTCRPIDHRRLRRWSLGRLLAKHGIPMDEDVTKMFTAQMVLRHTSSRSNCRNEKGRQCRPANQTRRLSTAGRTVTSVRQLPHLIVTLAPRPDQIGVEFAHSTSSTTMLRIASRSSADSVSMKPFASANRTMP